MSRGVLEPKNYLTILHDQWSFWMQRQSGNTWRAINQGLANVIGWGDDNMDVYVLNENGIEIVDMTSCSMSLRVIETNQPATSKCCIL
jgi:hypothetical protein